MQKKTNLLLIFLLSLSIFSCKKEAVTEPEPEVLLADQVPVITLILKDLVLQTVIGAMLTPELHGLQGVQGDTRDACITSNILDPDDGTFPATLTQTFAATPVGAACLLADGIPVEPTIVGILTAEFKGPVLTDVSSGKDDVAISLSPDFTVNGYTVELLEDDGTDIDNQLWMNKAGTTVPTYNLFLPTGGINVSNGSTSTTLYGQGDNNLMGRLQSSDDPDSNDDPNDPRTYIDNEFKLTIEESVVLCTDDDGNFSYLCADVRSFGGSNPLVLQPTTCNCIKNGNLRLRELDVMNLDDAQALCGGGANNTNNDFIYSFGFNVNGDNSTGCDNGVRRRDNRAGNTAALRSDDFLTITACD